MSHFTFALLCLATACTDLQAANPFAKTTAVVPAISFTESHTEKLVQTADPLVAGLVNRSVSMTTAMSVTMTADISSMSIGTINASTPFAVSIGGANITFLLGDVPGYFAGQTTVFWPWAGWDVSGKPIGTRGIKLVWTTTKLIVTWTMDQTDAGPGSIVAESIVNSADPFALPVWNLHETIEASLRFGILESSTPRLVFYTAKGAVTKYHYGSGATSEDHIVRNITVSGAAEYVAPSVVLTSPASSTIASGTATIKGKVTDTYGFGQLEWAFDQWGPWTPVTDISPVTSPPIGEWGTTVKTWQVVTPLSYGTNKVWVRAVDTSSNVSAPIALSVVNPLPKALVGRWDALLEDDFINRGCYGSITFTLSSNGSYTGSVNWWGGRCAFSGSILPNGVMQFSFRDRFGHFNNVSASIQSFAVTDESQAAISGRVDTFRASFTAFRSPWSPVHLADTAMAGRFHVALDGVPRHGIVGQGFLILNTTRTGTATVTGTLADGIGFTWIGVLGAGGQIPAFASPYNVDGRFSAGLVINPATHTIAGSRCFWSRPTGYSDKQFPDGFNEPLSAWGAAYSPPPTGVRLLGAGNGSPNVIARTYGDGLVTAVSKSFTLNSNNTSSIPTDVRAMSLPFTASTGLGTGSFKLDDGSTATVKTLICGQVARGFYTAPALTGQTQKRRGAFSISPIIASGQLDPAFSVNGIVTTPIDDEQDSGQAVAVQGDGKIVVAGFAKVGSTNAFALARYMPGGGLDTAFGNDPFFSGSGGIVTTTFAGADAYGRSVAIQTDGKIVVAGYRVTTVEGNSDFIVARYTAEGRLDPTFGTEGIFTASFSANNEYAYDVAVQHDGKIVVVGMAVIAGEGLPRIAVARCTSNGVLDATFDSDGLLTTPIGIDDSARSVIIQPDDNILVAGYAGGPQSHDFVLLRYTPNGLLDLSFGGWSTGFRMTGLAAGADDYAYDLTLQQDNRIIVVGSTFTGCKGDMAVVRYLPTGREDVTFGSDGKASYTLAAGNDEAYSVALQKDGKIVVGGYANSLPSDFAVMRLNSAGGLDATFNGTGKVISQIGSDNEVAYGLALQADGGIVLAGFSSNGTNNDFALVRYGN